MKRKTNRRDQTPKSRNLELAKAMQELRRSSATMPIPSGKAYKRPAPGKRWE